MSLAQDLYEGKSADSAPRTNHWVSLKSEDLELHFKARDLFAILCP